MAGWWYTYPSEKYKFVNGRDYPMYLMYYGKWSKSLKPPTRWDLNIFEWDEIAFVLQYVTTFLVIWWMPQSIGWLQAHPGHPRRFWDSGLPNEVPAVLVGPALIEAHLGEHWGVHWLHKPKIATESREMRWVSVETRAYHRWSLHGLVMIDFSGRTPCCFYPKTEVNLVNCRCYGCKLIRLAMETRWSAPSH